MNKPQFKAVVQYQVRADKSGQIWVDKPYLVAIPEKGSLLAYRGANVTTYPLGWWRVKPETPAPLHKSQGVRNLPNIVIPDALPTECNKCGQPMQGHNRKECERYQVQVKRAKTGGCTTEACVLSVHPGRCVCVTTGGLLYMMEKQALAVCPVCNDRGFYMNYMVTPAEQVPCEECEGEL